MKAKILIVLILPAILASCDDKISRCNLTEAQKQLIPYEKEQVISFIDSAGLTVDLTVTESQVWWTSKERFGGAFYDSYITNEAKSVILESESNNLEVRLTICNSGYSECSNYSSLSISIDTNSINSSWFRLNFDTEGNFSTDSYSSIHDSLEINGKVYYNVVEINKGSEQLFYNKTYGILQVRKDGENFLTLKD